ncbi:MAG: hypothetical protein JW751_09270 [Polyangiaceae bacterium]|nr:hypothetical protein [Polyangiaceae bacterium]
MADPWAVFVVANHTRMEILVQAAPVVPAMGPDSDDTPPTLSSCPERRFVGADLCAHWEFSQDRMMVMGTAPAGEAAEAGCQAERLRGDPESLASACPGASVLLAGGYRVLAGDALRTAASDC